MLQIHGCLYPFYAQIHGCNSVLEELLDGRLVRPDWSESFYPQAFSDLSSNGRQPIAGLLLILQVEKNPGVLADMVTKYVNQNCVLYPSSQLEYIIFEGVTHLPLMYASPAHLAQLDRGEVCRR